MSWKWEIAQDKCESKADEKENKETGRDYAVHLNEFNFLCVKWAVVGQQDNKQNKQK